MCTKIRLAKSNCRDCYQAPVYCPITLSTLAYGHTPKKYRVAIAKEHQFQFDQSFTYVGDTDKLQQLNIMKIEYCRSIIFRCNRAIN